MKSQLLTSIWVRKAPLGTVQDGLLIAGHHSYRCKLGITGITARKSEGDGAPNIGKELPGRHHAIPPRHLAKRVQGRPGNERAIEIEEGGGGTAS